MLKKIIDLVGKQRFNRGAKLVTVEILVHHLDKTQPDDLERGIEIIFKPMRNNGVDRTKIPVQQQPGPGINHVFQFVLESYAGDGLLDISWGEQMFTDHFAHVFGKLMSLGRDHARRHGHPDTENMPFPQGTKQHFNGHIICHVADKGAKYRWSSVVE